MTNVCSGVMVLTAGMILAGCEVSSPCAPSVAVPGKAIRVGSYNIRYVAGDRGTENDWVKRRDDLVAQVRGFDFDVFGLQEVDPEQMQYLREKLHGFSFVGEHRNADRKSGEASPVVYRKNRFDVEDSNTFWLSNTPDVPGSQTKSWGAACRRVCTYAVLRDRRTGKRLCFANAHIDHRKDLACNNGMRLILDRMKAFSKGAPVVFTGDHNCVETFSAVTMATNVLKNALYASERPPDGPWASAGGFARRDLVSCAEAMKLPVQERNSKEGRKKLGGMRIDYIYVSHDIRVIDYRTDAALRPGLDLYPSDHFPIVATVQLQ